MCIGKTLNMYSCSKFWGNLEGIWGNPGEIPHIGWKTPRVYRVKPQFEFVVLLYIYVYVYICDPTRRKGTPRGIL